MMYPYIDNYFMFYPRIPAICDMPPTLYSILESIVNYGKDEKTKIKDLAKVGRSTIFDFDYTLTNNISKEDFECMILNHFLMRRIGYETVTAFKIALSVKLNEIMPIYNKMFDMLEGWNLFNDGEVETKVILDMGQSSASTTTDNRYSDTPQGMLTSVQDGTYMTDYTYNQGSSSGSDSRTRNETITRSPSNKIKIYKDFLENKESIYSMIFKDLDTLFYGLVM